MKNIQICILILLSNLLYTITYSVQTKKANKTVKFGPTEKEIIEAIKEEPAEDAVKLIDKFITDKNNKNYPLGEILITAALNGTFEMVQKLLDAGAKVNIRRPNPDLLQLTPLNAALLNSKEDDSTKLNIIKLLLEHGANPYIKSKGQDAFEIAQIIDATPEIISQLNQYSSKELTPVNLSSLYLKLIGLSGKS